LGSGLPDLDVFLLAADERLVALDDLAFTADRRGVLVAHGLAQTHGHEPSGLVGHAQHALHLLGGDALLAGAHQMSGQHPLVQADLLCRPIFERSNTVPTVTLNCSRQSLH
jgi:hypothetical protein